MTALGLLASNNAASVLASAIGTASTSITLAATTGELFPLPSGSQYFVGTISDADTGLIREIVWCTARDVDVLTVARAQEGTSALAWNEGDNFQNLWTVGQLASILAAIAAISAPSAGIVSSTGTSLTAANLVNLSFNTETNTLSAQAGGAPAYIPDFVSGNFYKVAACGSAGIDITNLDMVYYPMYIPNAVTVASLSANVTNPIGSGSIRFALYSDNAGKPGALLYDSRTIAVNTAGVVTQSGVSTALAAGTVWIGSGFLFNGGGNAQCIWLSNDPNAYGANPFDAIVPSASVSAAFSFQNLGWASTDSVTLSGELPSPPSGLSINQSQAPLLIVLGIE